MGNSIEQQRSEVPLLSSEIKTDNSWNSWRKKRLIGWRFGVISCAAWTTVVLLVNISLLTVSLFKYGPNKDSRYAGRRLIFEGDCQKARNLSVGLHLLINTLSTVLLSSSNYCMQCLSAPTRKEIDKAHSKSEWLDVGIVSIRNLRRISWKRAVLWGLILLSSLPIHLL
jgi:hypothetical protein